MVKITVLCVGKLKERYFTDAVAEYSKRLSRYCQLQIIEVPDEKAPEQLSKAQMEAIKKKEGDRLLANIRPEAMVIALTIEGKAFSSEELAEFFSGKMTEGTSHIQLVIGGSLGLSDEVIRASSMQLSFSKMTFPHQLMRVILLEQIYRSFRIIHKEPYHK